MRSTTVLAGVAATALIGLATPTAAHTATGEPSAAGSTTEKQRGIVLACAGTADGLDAYVELYENQRYGNNVHIVLDEDPAKAGMRSPKKDFWNDGTIRTGVEIDGKRAKVRGIAVKVGKRIPVHFEIDDDGYHIEDEGWQRRIANDLVLTYGTATVPLDCSDAFSYNITTTRTPL